MKQFFKEHSYNMVKMFLNQFATSIFGLVLALAAGKAQNPTLRNITSVCAILFYMFLLYTMTWEIGYGDKIAVEHGKKPRNPFTGALISLCANVIGFVCAIFITLASLFDVAFFATLGGISTLVNMLLNGMYVGLLANQVGGVPLNSHWFMWFIIIIPAVLISGIAYNMGLRDIKFTSLFDHVYPESDREPKKKRKD